MIQIQRVALVEPGQFPFGFHVPNMYRGEGSSGVLMPRFGPQMAAWLKQHGFDATVFSGEVMPLHADELAGYDAVCISTLSNTAPHSLVLAHQVRTHNPNVPVVMGGYHFAHTEMRPETLAQTNEALRFCDRVVRGEGYNALPLLLNALRGNGSFEAVGGLSWRDPNGVITHNEMGTSISPSEYAALPPADWSAVQHVERMRCLGVHGVKGCPRTCSWCAIWTRDGNGVDKTNATRVVEEIVAALQPDNFLHLFFTSDNFPVNHKWATQVCEELIRRGVRIDWSCQGEARIIVQHPELVQLMAKSGCVRVCMGIESINQSTLDAISKGGQNQQMIEEAIHICHANGIAVHGMFICGLPGDTRDTAENTRRWAQRHKIDTAQFLCLSDFPGSPDYEQHKLWNVSFRPFEGRLGPLNWLFDNGHYARLTNDAMTLDEVQQASISAMSRFYSWGRVVEPLLRPNLRTFCAGLRQGRGLWGAVKRSAMHQLITAALRYRGRTSVDAWNQHPLNQAYRELLRTAPDSVSRTNACAQLLALLPPGWVETFEAVA